MTKLAETYIRLRIQLTPEDRRRLRRKLQERSRLYADGLFGQTVDTAAYVEEGSVKVWVVAGGLLVAAAGKYGDFRSGIDYAIKDARTFSERVLEDLQFSGIEEQEVARFERRLGIPGKISQIMDRLELLESHGRDMSKEAYEEEVELIRKALLAVFRRINPRDADFVHDALPQSIRIALPKRLPHPPAEMPRIVLRPEDLEISVTRLLTRNAADLSNQHDPRARSEARTAERKYVLVDSLDGFALLPKG